MKVVFHQRRERGLPVGEQRVRIHRGRKQLTLTRVSDGVGGEPKGPRLAEDKEKAGEQTVCKGPFPQAIFWNALWKASGGFYASE